MLRSPPKRSAGGRLEACGRPILRDAVLRTAPQDQADRSATASIHILLENRLDRAIPRAVEFLQQFLRRRDAAGDRFLERAQIARLVAAVAVEILAAGEPMCGEPQRLLRQREHVAAADFRLEAEFGHVVAQLLPLLRAPILDHVPALSLIHISEPT